MTASRYRTLLERTLLERTVWRPKGFGQGQVILEGS